MTINHLIILYVIFMYQLSLNSTNSETEALSELDIVQRLLESYDQVFIANYLNRIPKNNWTRETINRWVKGKASPKLTKLEYDHLVNLLPKPVVTADNYEFKFIDLFAGIGGIRKGFEEQGGLCVFTSEWDKFSTRTYKANYYNDELLHVFNSDIREITLSNNPLITDEEAYANIAKQVPDHDVLLAGFPCQPFSIAGVSKKQSLGVKHGFECDTQGTLFFDVARIIAVKRPAAFVLENVKNLKSHDRGRTFKTILKAMDELGYEIADADHSGVNDPKIINGAHWVPQNRERIVLVGFRRDLDVHKDFSLSDINRPNLAEAPTIGSILESEVADKYVLTPNLWKYLVNYAKKHQEKGNGFGFGLIGTNDRARTLSARYYKDGSEILIDRGWDFNKSIDDESNLVNRPRRLTPLECSRLMGFSSFQGNEFKIPVSDTQAYKQFGNSVVVPMFSEIARYMKPFIMKAKGINRKKSAA